ncbi:MAG: hypothetical protein WCC45_20315 [Paeniglutamicibacter sp.]
MVLSITGIVLSLWPDAVRVKGGARQLPVNRKANAPETGHFQKMLDSARAQEYRDFWETSIGRN